MSFKDYELLEDTIFVYLNDDEYDSGSSSDDKFVLATLSEYEYHGCCGCDETDEEYIQMKKLTHIVDDSTCFEYANCGNGNCIHILKLCGIIKSLFPTYPFDFDENPNIASEMKKYVSDHINNENFIEEMRTKYNIPDEIKDPKEVFNEARRKFYDEILSYAETIITTNKHDIDEQAAIISKNIDVPFNIIKRILEMFVYR